MYHNIPLFEDCISLFYLSGCCHAWMEEKKKAIPSQISTCGTLRGKLMSSMQPATSSITKKPSYSTCFVWWICQDLSISSAQCGELLITAWDLIVRLVTETHKSHVMPASCGTFLHQTSGTFWGHVFGPHHRIGIIIIVAEAVAGLSACCWLTMSTQKQLRGCP